MATVPWSSEPPINSLAKDKRPVSFWTIEWTPTFRISGLIVITDVMGIGRFLIWVAVGPTLFWCSRLRGVLRGLLVVRSICRDSDTGGRRNHRLLGSGERNPLRCRFLGHGCSAGTCEDILRGFRR